MYYKLKTGKLRELVEKARVKESRFRNLAELTGIPKSTLFNYYQEKRLISESNLKILERYSNFSVNDEEIEDRFPDNWKQIIGGKNCVKAKKKNGIFEKQIKECQKASSAFMKKHHKEWKEKNPESYHISQYEKFKKIAEYKFITKKGERVRNKLELDTADKLTELGIEYEYEPLVKGNGKYFFPDFLINKKIIIECTMWQGYDKAVKLAQKIEKLRDRYRIYILIPKALNKYYQTLNNHLIFGLDEIKTW